MDDTLTGAAAHASFAESHHLSNGEIFLIGFLGVLAFMLLLLAFMKLSPFIASRIDRKKGKTL
ncbi:MAG: hypothetical protein J6T56_03520 [Bacteroidales bacterium]|nr:hypothetical protein [Bacteroidales bacterium]MBP5395717.1 hypothetical protein [Bacteroidales bacterium]MBP5612954.1 hypothetical protein [Bacteroidales bacterium]